MKEKTGIFLNRADETESITLRGPVLGNKDFFLEEGDYICPSSFEKALGEVKGDRVEVVINSQGGDVFAAIEIYNALKNSGKEVTTVISGRAFSGGHIIAMAGDERLIYNNSQGLAHRASTVAWGNALDLLETIDWLEKIDENILNIYMDNFTGSKEELEALLDEDKPINAEDCVKYGFATRVIENKERDLAVNISSEQVFAGLDIDEIAKLVMENLAEKEKVEKQSKIKNEDERSDLFTFFKGVK